MIFGKYQLLELIGTGGMAEVFKAKSYGVEGFEKLLVIKRILSHYSNNEEFVEMFVNEAKIAVSLNHVNVVQIYDLGKAGESYFIAMEYVQGMDLAEILNWSVEHQKPIPLEAAIHILCEVAKGLDYAHRKKDQDGNPLDIIHRDISPQNILVSVEGEVKITDFGIAKAMNILDGADDSPIQGKFAYMAPEQAIAAPNDKRVDIFSAGIVFYEMLSGINPLKNRTPAENIKLIQSEQFPDCSVPCCGGPESIPVDLEPLLRKALAPDPAHRFESAAELYEELLTFSYMMGLRAGAGSLAEYVTPIMEEKENTPFTSIMPPLPSVVSRVTSIHETPSNVTSVNRPSNAELAQFEDRNAIHLTSSVRDVALLVYSWDATGFDSKKLQKSIASKGGVLLEKEDTMLLFGFGVQVASDALFMAADTAFNTMLSLERDPAFKSSENWGIAIHSAALVVESNGNVKLNSSYKKALLWCNKMATVKQSAIIFSGLFLPLIERHYQCGVVIDDDIDDLFQIWAQKKEAPHKSKLVGRRNELKRFGDLLATVSEGKGQILALTGSAGVGKSRILSEVKRRLTAGGHNVSWLDTTCSPWNKKQPYSAVLSLFRAILQLSPNDSQNDLQKKMKELEEFQLSAVEFSAVKKLLFTQRGENTSVVKGALIRIIRHIAKSTMTVVVVDHLTAIDDESLDILHALSQGISDVPVLLAVAIRLGYIHGFEGSPIFTDTIVAPLSDSEMEQLIHDNVNSPSAKLVEDIIKVSANIPKFAEEYIYDLQNKGALKVLENESIYTPKMLLCPFTIRDIVSSELHALPQDRRKILQLASCLGEKFDAEILGLLLNKSIADLDPVLQILSKVKLLSQVDDSTFEFLSPFIQEAVYFSIEKNNRLLIHRTVAQKIEQEFPKELDKYSEQLAVHYLKSNSKRAAYDYLITAAQNTALMLDFESSVKYYLLALDLTLAGLGSVSKFDIFEQLAIMAPQTTQVDTVLTQAILLKSEIDADSAAAALTLEAQEALLQAHMGEYHEAKLQLEDVISCQIDKEQSISKRYLAQTLIDCGKIGDALTILNAICNPTDEEPDLDAYPYLAICFALTGEKEKALKEIEKHPPASSTAPLSILYLLAEGHCLFMGQNYPLAIEAYGTAMTFAQEQNLAREKAHLHYQIAICQLELEDFKEAFEALHKSIHISTDLQHQSLRDKAQICLSYIDAAKFKNTAALTYLLGLEEETTTVETEILLQYCLAKLFTRQKENAKAKAHLLKGKERCQASQNHFYLNQIEKMLRTI